MKAFIKNQPIPNRNPKQLMNTLGKLKGSEVTHLKVSKDLSRMIIIQANLQLSAYEFSKNKMINMQL